MDISVIEESKNVNLVQFEELFKDYICDPNYVFKSTRDAIVVLKKTVNETNEEREVYDSKYALYRGNEFFVVEIRNRYIPSEILSFTWGVYNLWYESGKKITYGNYDYDIERVYFPGIHYYKTLEPAFYNLMDTKNFTGVFKMWCCNGRLIQLTEYVNGKKHGLSKFMNHCGDINRKCYYKNNKKHGVEIENFNNGKIRSKQNYKDGVLHGISEYYSYTSGKLIQKQDYVEGDCVKVLVYEKN